MNSIAKWDVELLIRSSVKGSYTVITTWNPDDDDFFEQWSRVPLTNLSRSEDASKARTQEVDFHEVSARKLAFRRAFTVVPEAGDVFEIEGDILQLEIQSVELLCNCPPCFSGIDTEHPKTLREDGKARWVARFLWRC